MRIIVVDDECIALEGIVAAVKAAAPQAELQGFRDGNEAFLAARKNPPDVAFLDIALRGENGIQLARDLKGLNPRVNIIFVSGYGHYMGDAFAMHASGYVMKPVDKEAVLGELGNLRYPLQARKRLKVRTFGDFSVSAGGLPLVFAYARTLELLALLVDANGSLCSIQKLTETMWNGADTKAHRSYLRNLLADLRHTLDSVGASDILVSVRGAVCLDRNKIDCDYFDFLDRKPDSKLTKRIPRCTANCPAE